MSKGNEERQTVQVTKKCHGMISDLAVYHRTTFMIVVEMSIERMNREMIVNAGRCTCDVKDKRPGGQHDNDCVNNIPF